MCRNDKGFGSFPFALDQGIFEVSIAQGYGSAKTLERGLTRKGGGEAEENLKSTAKNVWCPGPESNRHALRRGILSPLRLPISPPGHAFLIDSPMQSERSDPTGKSAIMSETGRLGKPLTDSNR